MSSKVLITGSEGQLGRVLQEQLGKYFNLIPTAKNPSEIAIRKRRVRQMDITDISSVESCLEIEKPDVIINCAAMTNVDACEKNHTLAQQINVKGVENIIKSTSSEVKILQLSTDYVFDGKDGPYCETDPTHPISYYGRTKLEAENLLRGSLKQHSILRCSILYGNPLNSKANFFSWVYDSLSQNKRINVVTDQTSNPTWMSALGNVILKMILLNGEGVYHYGSYDSMSRYEFAVMIAEVFGLNSNLINPVISDSMNFIARRPAHSGLKTNKVSEILDVVTLPIIEHLKMMKDQALLT